MPGDAVSAAVAERDGKRARLAVCLTAARERHACQATSASGRKARESESESGEGKREDGEVRLAFSPVSP